MDFIKDFIFIADDLTGAGDTGVQIRKFFDDVYISTSVRNLKDNMPVIFDTESRDMDKDKLNEVLENFSEAFKSKKIVYKKIDSTLRGNVLVELEIVCQKRNNAPVFFVPAFPEMNRKIENGILKVNDIALCETEYVNISKNIPISDNIENYCPEGYNYFYVNNADFEFPENMQNCFFGFECKDNHDLIRIANVILKKVKTTDITIAASAALSYFILKQAGYREKTDFSPLISLQTYFICGSLNSINEKLIKNINIDKIIIDNIRFIEDNSYFELKIHEIIKKLLFGKNIAVFTERLLNENIKHELDQKIVELFKRTYSLSPRIVLSGGSTAYSCIRGIDKYFFKISNIVDTGIPLINIDDREIIIKPGGFGNNKFFINLVEESK
ncbi:MAG: four-carbon acid sugar kinase family protein [Candidatus Muirbacterium halophilum]|nr:four-carbon acid sugar kinase family protein [Candidatus Muirbacterium halophilum]